MATVVNAREYANMNGKVRKKPAATGEEMANIDGKVISFITGVHSTFRQHPISGCFGQYVCKINIKTISKNGMCLNRKNKLQLQNIK